MKRFLAVVLCVTMLVSLLGVFPAFADGQATIVSMTAEDVAIYEHTHGSWVTEEVWDNELQARFEKTYWSYHVLPPSATVTLSDGSVVTGDLHDLADQFETTCYTSYSDAHKWTVGNTYTLGCGLSDIQNARTNFNMTIVPSPVESVTVADKTVMIGSNTYTTGHTNSQGQYVEYEAYYCEPDNIIVSFNDGRPAFEGSFNELEDLYGYENVSESDDQSEDNIWGVGEHTATISVLGASCEFKVNITESPVKEVYVPDMEVIEGTDGYMSGYWDENDNYISNAYWRYSLNFNNITVKFKDNTSFTGTSYELYRKTGYSFESNDDQSYQNQWGLGEHTVSFQFMGVKSSCKVNIVPSPVKSIVVDPIKVIEHADGYTNYHYNNDVRNKYFRYSITPRHITITMNDGTVYDGTYDEVCEALNEWPSYYDDQSYENEWSVGDHTASLSFFGKTVEYTVSVIPSPVQSAQIDEITLMEDFDGYFTGEEEKKFVFSLSSEAASYSVTLKDGTVLKSKDGEVTYNNKKYYVMMDDYNEDETWEVGKTYTPDATIMGYPVKLTVNTIKNQYASFEISGTHDLTLTFTKKDNTKDVYRVNELYLYGYDGANAYCELYTDKKTLYGVKLAWDESDPYMKGLTLTVGKMTSNAISGCSYVKAHANAYRYGYDFEYLATASDAVAAINGNVTTANLDGMVEFAYYVYNEDDETDRTVSADKIAKMVTDIFAVDNIDITKCSWYKDGQVTIPERDYVEFIIDDSKLEYKNGAWVLTHTLLPREGQSGKKHVTFTFDEKVRIKSVDFSNADKPQFTDVKAGEYYEEPVQWAVTNGVTNGTGANTFSPNNKCTRGQVVTFLWRAAGAPEPTTTVNPFTDVKESDYFYKAVLWAVENGVTSGTSKTTFSPASQCTRGQVVTFLWRAKGQAEPTKTTHAFTDVQNGAYYYKAMLWAIEKNITNGTSATKFSPNNTCTRGQVVTFLYRAFN